MKFRRVVESFWLLLVNAKIVPGSWRVLYVFHRGLLVSANMNVFKSGESSLLAGFLIVSRACRCFPTLLNLYSKTVELDTIMITTNRMQKEKGGLHLDQSSNYYALDYEKHGTRFFVAFMPRSTSYEATPR